MRNLSKLRKRVKFLIFVVFPLTFFFIGWLSHSVYYPQQQPQKPSVLDKIKKTKNLNVVLLNAPSTYYIGPDGPQGFEYELLKDYAKHLGVNLNITSANTVKEAIELGKNENIHIISAALAKTSQREKRFNFGPSYFEVQEQVVCNRAMVRDGTFPRTVEDLAGLNIMVGEDTSYSETILSLQKDGFDINATFTSDYSTEELLEMVSNRQIDCTLAASNIYSLNKRYFTEISSAFTVTGREQLAWVLADGSDELEADMYSWLNSYNQSGRMAELKDHYYSHILYFDYYDTKMFYKRIKTRLPKYEKLFKEAAQKYDVSWKLVAAQSYQESHWNPRAKSFTGVRGLMMLTRSTAKYLGVKNRLDPKQSIYGGVRHLNQMIKSVPDEVDGENRIKFALAAYNVGMGHVKDAQVLAKRFGLDKNTWRDLKAVLPLLSQKRYYRTLKYGYARGSEPVRYVESIYDYKDILENLTNEKEDINTSIIIEHNETNISN
jgi:membrane-bound lytic murein transglycosylase F